MSPKTKELLEQVQSWPEEDQEELANVAREIESRRSGMLSYLMKSGLLSARAWTPRAEVILPPMMKSRRFIVCIIVHEGSLHPSCTT